MSRVFTAFAALLLTCSIATAETARLQYLMAPDPGEINVRHKYHRMFTRAPKDMAGFPVTNLAKPLVGRTVARRFIVLDASANNRAFDIAWIDINGDGKWQESEKFSLSDMGDHRQLSAIVPMEFPNGGGVTVQHFMVGSAGYRGSYIRSAGYYTGTVAFGEKQHKVALVDANSSGSFVDTATAEDQGDLILIDRNDDGKFDVGDAASESTAFTNMVGVDGAFWHVAAAVNGSSISIEKADVPMGKLTVKEPDVSIVLAGQNGDVDITRAPGEQDFPVPAGVWQIKSVIVRRADDQKRIWTLRSCFGTGESITVAEGFSASIEIPGNLAWTIDARGVENRVYARLKDSATKLDFYLSPPDGRIPFYVKAIDGSWQQQLDMYPLGRGRSGADIRNKGKAEVTSLLQDCPFAFTLLKNKIELK